MKELKETLEIIGLDFNLLISQIQEYLKEFTLLRSSSETLRGFSAECRSLFLRDLLPDIRIFFETLTLSLTSLRHSPIFNDPRVVLFEKRVQEMFSSMREPERRFIPVNQQEVNKFKEYLIELKETLDREAEIPYSDIEQFSSLAWRRETEEGLF